MTATLDASHGIWLPTAHLLLPNRRMKPTADAIANGQDGLFDASHEPHELASSNLTVEGAST